MAVSKFILDISKEIELKSGLKMHFAQGTIHPTEKWITEREMSEMKVVQLRTAEDTKKKNVTLPQFNPSFFLKDASERHCGIPGCSVAKPRSEATNSPENIKQGLFLCRSHRETLSKKVATSMAIRV